MSDIGGWGEPAQASGPEPNWGAPASMFPSRKVAGVNVGKYYNSRNVSGQQFNKPAIMDSVKKGLEQYQDAKYFRTHGMGAALRHTLGMRQLPSHRQDDINTRVRNSQQPVQGKNPGSWIGNISAGNPMGPESAESFDYRHGADISSERWGL